MMDLQCPTCGAPIHFSNSISVMATCTHCRGTIIRNEKHLENLGVQSAFMQDLSPFQVYTEGKFEKRHFTLLGRLKIVYDGGTWSEWFAWFDDGQHGWLAEAQGFYMMSFETPLPDNIKPGLKYAAGSDIIIGQKKFMVDDVKQVEYNGMEGELPFRFYPGEKATSIDCRSKEGEFASITFTKTESKLYLGKYCNFDELDFKNLRTLSGWKR